MRKKNTQNPRLAAVEALAEVLDQNRSLVDARALSRLKDGRDNALARHLAYGVLRWLGALQWLAAELLSKPMRHRDRDIERLILLGLHQLWQDHMASHAAVNETAQCARLLGKGWAVAVVNAVLRRFQRERDTLLEQLAGNKAVHAHPSWLLDEIQSDWPEHWRSIVRNNNCQAPLWLRINRHKADESLLRTRLQSADFKLDDHPLARDAISIKPPAPVARIPGFEDGWLSVQDPAAQLARDLIDPHPGERILDACAAPGGKTAHLLESCPQLKLTILDKQQHRIDQIHQNLERLGLLDLSSQARIQVCDATDTASWWDGKKFDKILLDAPCSATGVIRRHPEIKWLRNPEQVDAVVRTQYRLLTALWSLLDTGGMLVYATCSLLRPENSGQIQRFLEQHADAVAVIPDLDGGTAVAGGYQFMPGDEQMDGFFYAVLQKSA